MFDKFLFGNKQIPEMYFGNIPVAKIYFGNTLIWEKEGYVPYDNSCTAIISLTANEKSWVVTVEKDGEDVTSSFASMIPWIYNANNVRFDPKVRIYTNTVDLSSFGRGEYRLDLSQITSKVGASSYFPSSGVVSAPDHVYIGGGNNLVAGNQNVAIEYDLTNATYPVTVSSIEIFTDSSSNSSAKIKILHESGLFIAAIDGDTKGTQEERFGLTGYSHSVDNLSVYLEKGHKYYIVYQGSTNEAFYPSRFQNENGKYKVYANTTDASSITCGNFSTLGNFVGAIGNGDSFDSHRAEIIALNENDSFMWNGWNGSQGVVPKIIQRHFYRRKSSTIVATETVELTGSDSHYKLAKLLLGIKRNTNVIQSGEVNNESNSGKIARMKGSYTSQITASSDESDEPINLQDFPSNPVDKGLYYVQNHVRVYEDNTWKDPWQYYLGGNYYDYVDYPDWWYNDFEDLNVSYTVDTNLTTTTLNTDKHFYLKINGMEV